MSSCRNFPYQGFNTDDVGDADEIVGEDMKRHLSADVLQPLHLEMRCTRPGFDGAKRVQRLIGAHAFSRGVGLTAQAHHRADVLVPIARCGVLFPWCTRMEWADETQIEPVAPGHHTLLIT